MPLFEYACPKGHRVETIRKYDRRDDAPACPECGEATVRQFSHTHSPPSGVYSYCPNLGDPGQFERRLHAMKHGIKVIPKEA